MAKAVHPGRRKSTLHAVVGYTQCIHVYQFLHGNWLFYYLVDLVVGQIHWLTGI